MPKNIFKLVLHTDNNLINYDNRTFHERFPEVELNAREKNNTSYGSVKTILRVYSKCKNNPNAYIF